MSEPGVPDSNVVENLNLLGLDKQRVEFKAAAIMRGAVDRTWSILVVDAVPEVPRAEVSIGAVARDGTIYMGRGRWLRQTVSPDQTMRTDVVEGIGQLQVMGNMSDLPDSG